MPFNLLDSDVSDRDAAELFYRLFRKHLCSLLGDSAGKAVLVLIKRAIQQELDKAFLKSPKKVYEELYRIFGEGTKVLMNIVLSGINRECRLNIEPGRLIELMCSEDQSRLEEMRSIMRLIAKSYWKSHGEAR